MTTQASNPTFKVIDAEEVTTPKFKRGEWVWSNSFQKDMLVTSVQLAEHAPAWTVVVDDCGLERRFRETSLIPSNMPDVSNRQMEIVPLEPVLVTSRGSWLWCSVRERGMVITQRYLHVECDVLTDENGNCIDCGAPSPTSTAWR